MVGSDTHEVSCLGRVRSWVRKRSRDLTRLSEPVIVEPHKTLGYLQVSVRINGSARAAYLHRLVLEAFVGPCPDGMQACHFPSRDTHDCAWRNLRWTSRAENGLDAVANNAGLAATLTRLAQLQAEFPWLRAADGLILKSVSYERSAGLSVSHKCLALPPPVESLTRGPTAPISSRSGESATQWCGWAPALDEARS